MTSFLSGDKFVFLDIDIADSHAKYLRAADFVDATDLRYNFSSKDILKLGGREVQSVQDFYEMDYEWSMKGPIITKPQEACRVVIKLFEDTSPLACENFEALCTGSKGKAKASGLPLHFKGVKFHRIVPDFIIQGGDIVMQNGTGGESIFGKKFRDERPGLARKHDKAGIVSMCNSGKNSNTSQFFITLREGGCPQCDGKHVVFGEVVSGMEVLRAVEAAVVQRGGDETDSQAVVHECGLWNTDMPIQGYWAPGGLFLQPQTADTATPRASTDFASASARVDAAEVKAMLVHRMSSVSEFVDGRGVVPLVIVLAAKSAALPKFRSSLEKLEGVVVVYSADVSEAVTIIEECLSFRRTCAMRLEDRRCSGNCDRNINDHSDNCHSSCAESDPLCVLAGVVVGSTVSERNKSIVLDACQQGPHPVQTGVCKPSEALFCLASA